MSDEPHYPTEGLRLAALKGKEHGKNAASCLYDGNTSTDYFLAFAKGLDDGDTEWVDKIPHADLSGQNADTYSSEDLRREFPDEDYDDLATAYEEGWDAGVMDEVNRVLQLHTGEILYRGLSAYRRPPQTNGAEHYDVDLRSLSAGRLTRRTAPHNERPSPGWYVWNGWHSPGYILRDESDAIRYYETPEAALEALHAAIFPDAKRTVAMDPGKTTGLTP